MDTFEIAYESALLNVEDNISQTLKTWETPKETDIQVALKSESSLDA